MKLLEVINEVWGLDCKSKCREISYVDARRQAIMIMRKDFKMGVWDVANSLGLKSNGSVTSLVYTFDGRYKSCKPFRDKYRDVRVKLGLEKGIASTEYGKLTESKALKKIIINLEELSEQEILDFIPRTQLYVKSVIYNRKKKKEWERPKQQA